MNDTMNKSESESWENWIDVWAGFWLEGVALPIVAVFGIIGERHIFKSSERFYFKKYWTF